MQPWYEYCFALDVGWRKTAALWGARDPETDILYLWSEHYRESAPPSEHAVDIKARNNYEQVPGGTSLGTVNMSRGSWIPGVIDPAARGSSQADGERLMQQYVDLGLTLSPADNAVTSGIYAVWERMISGRLKVFRTLQNFLFEMRIYRRDEKGNIVKENDHLMDCCRYLISSGLKIAVQKPVSIVAQAKGRHVSDYDPMAEFHKITN